MQGLLTLSAPPLPPMTAALQLVQLSWLPSAVPLASSDSLVYTETRAALVNNNNIWVIAQGHKNTHGCDEATAVATLEIH